MPSVGGTHHVKIGDVYCTLGPGGYRRRAAPLRGARVATGDHAYSDLSVWQYWVQHCWAGGIGADKWSDDSMFDSGVGLDTTIHEQVSLSRDLIRPTGGSLDSQSRKRRQFIVYKKPNGNKRLYCITYPTTGSSKLWKWTQSTSSWELIKAFDEDIQATCIASWSGEMAIGFNNGRIKSAENPDNNSWENRNPPRGESAGVTAMFLYRQRLYVAYGQTIYRRRRNWTVDGQTEFYDTGRDGGAVTSFETHLGFLYMGTDTGHLHRTDGNNTFDIWNWDGGTEIVSLRSFDGRLFVGTYEFSDDEDVGFGGLYQFTGSAVTQLKRWGKIGKSTTVGRFTVYDRRLYYGANALWGMNVNSEGTDLGGFGVAVYDPIEDAHSIWATNKDTTTYPDTSGTGAAWMVDDVIFWQGKMHVAVRGHGNFTTTITYRDYIEATVNYDTTTTAATGSANGGFLVSSLYDAGTPGLLKLWRYAEVEAYMDSNLVNVKLEYSTDSADSWTSLGTLQRTLTGTMVTSTGSPTVTGTGTDFTAELAIGDVIDIQGTEVTVQSIESDTSFTATANVGANESGTAFHTKSVFRRRWYFEEVKSARIQYRLILNTTDANESPVVRSVVLSYLPIPEPNWVWDLTIYNAEKVELLDGTFDEQDMGDAIATLAGYFRDQRVITFTDIDGTEWNGDGNGVLVWDFVEDHHMMGRGENNGEEGFLRLSILEVASEY